jgi:hypothetical protein
MLGEDFGEWNEQGAPGGLLHTRPRWSWEDRPKRPAGRDAHHPTHKTEPGTRERSW